ncbi:hypothetical protein CAUPRSCDRAFT_10802 [Caulochytrium protostelioides]|uniref:Uncharacterized protein n=1 Tax=Caulochytrium protostelioides TaxID=1555241 RepID=A0A4P9WVX9_9FUNG|nr:hypothetical protein CAUPRSCDRAFT_10802 [Caulochytrium protostelioides]
MATDQPVALRLSGYESSDSGRDSDSLADGAPAWADEPAVPSDAEAVSPSDDVHVIREGDHDDDHDDGDDCHDGVEEDGNVEPQDPVKAISPEDGADPSLARYADPTYEPDGRECVVEAKRIPETMVALVLTSRGRGLWMDLRSGRLSRTMPDAVGPVVGGLLAEGDVDAADADGATYTFDVHDTDDAFAPYLSGHGDDDASQNDAARIVADAPQTLEKDARPLTQAPSKRPLSLDALLGTEEAAVTSPMHLPSMTKEKGKLLGGASFTAIGHDHTDLAIGRSIAVAVCLTGTAHAGACSAQAGRVGRPAPRAADRTVSGEPSGDNSAIVCDICADACAAGLVPCDSAR